MQTPHDRLFRHVFADPAHAAGELQLVLPPELTRRIDWSSLVLVPGMLVDPSLAERRADLLFSVALDGRKAYVYLLFEHQSGPYPLMAFRLLGYVVRIWESSLREDPEARRLPPVLPLVLYHGASAWTGPVALQDLLDVDPELLDLLRPYTPSFEFFLDDLSQTRVEDLQARALTALARIALLCLQRARGSEDITRELAGWRETLLELLEARNGVEALATVLRYLFEVTDTPPERLRSLTRTLGPKAEEAYMTGAQILREQGRQEGRQEGQAALLLGQMEARFGKVNEDVRKRLESASEEALGVWGRRVLVADCLDAVFDPEPSDED